jgi:hypothetical protein
MLVLLQILGICIYSLIGEGGVLRHGTAGLYCEEFILEVKMSRNLEEIIDRALIFAIHFREIVWQCVCENLNKVLVIFWGARWRSG